MRWITRVAFVVAFLPALLAGCSGSKPDTPAQQACDQLAQLTKQINSTSGKVDVKSVARQIAETAGGSTNQAIVAAGRNLGSAASQGESAVKSAADSFIQACKDAGVKRPGS
jgi:hypothetical protein